MALLSMDENEIAIILYMQGYLLIGSKGLTVWFLDIISQL